MWWHIPVTPAVGMLKQDCYKFLTSLGYYYCLGRSREMAQLVSVCNQTRTSELKP